MRAREARRGVGQARCMDGQPPQIIALRVPVIATAQIHVIDARRINARPVEHSIHNMDGTIGRKNSYGPDPNPPKDKNR